MKIGILGGGGVRSPIILKMLSEFKFKEGLGEVRIYDIDQKKSDAILKLSYAILQKFNRRLNIVRCNSISEFAEGLNAVIFTIREGFEEGRAIDERLCLKYGIIGQETTGAAGFSFAVRTVPALIEYAQEIKKRSPDCILINFTNPAGIVVKALNLVGINDVIGICDSSDAARIHTAELYRRNRFDFDAEIVGLNHLSWTIRFFDRGKDILPSLIYDEKFYEIAHGPFTREIFTKDGIYKNEYLYYYYCTEDALKGMTEEKETRGEYLLRKNRELIKMLLQENSPDRLIEIYERYLSDRFTTYMSYAYREIKRRVLENESEGYAEIALKIISAIRDNINLNIPMILPNNGVIPFLPDDTVVEKFCRIRNGRISSERIDYKLPEFVVNLIKDVAEYETLAAQSILNRSFTLAEKALSVHPLIGSNIAGKILKEFSDVHKRYFEDFS
ncbi:MAG: hypothetical protein ACP5QK_10410 [Myxococcota bacterium]